MLARPDGRPTGAAGCVYRVGASLEPVATNIDGRLDLGDEVVFRLNEGDELRVRANALELIPVDEPRPGIAVGTPAEVEPAEDFVDGTLSLGARHEARDWRKGIEERGRTTAHRQPAAEQCSLLDVGTPEVLECPQRSIICSNEFPSAPLHLRRQSRSEKPIRSHEVTRSLQFPKLAPPESSHTLEETQSNASESRP